MGTLRRGLCLAFLERSPVSLRTDGSWQLRRRGLASAAATAVGTATATSISNYPVGLSEVLQERLRTSRARHEELNIKMQNGDVPTQDMGRAYKELSSLAATIDLADRAEVAAREAEEYSELVASTGKGGEAEDPWLHEQAKEELAVCTSSIPLLEASLAESLLPRNVEDDLSAILEVRAGSGGDEGALFAGELLGMYERYARSRNWQWRLLQMSTTDLGGCKEASAEVIGTGAFGALRTESGVHRVQRVPINDVRLHTSAATVAVLPEAPDIDVKLDPKEIKIDVYRSSGAGGQHVNTTESAVRLTHIPTGITVCMQVGADLLVLQSQFKEETEYVCLLIYACRMSAVSIRIGPRP
jgi:peptide chain release factor 1